MFTNELPSMENKKYLAWDYIVSKVQQLCACEYSICHVKAKDDNIKGYFVPT